MLTQEDGAGPPPERVRQMIRYSGGRFYWKSRPLSDFKSERAFDIWQRHHALSDVMQLNRRAWNTNNRRQTIRIDGQRYPILNVIWCWHHGEWPMGVVERIDGNPDNNSADNLRIAVNAP